jgi:hypothetical protein
MSGETFYELREMVLPGPSQTTGYHTILVIGTTGAGKSTLIRQLMGTDAADGFPATSASKTTVAETELLLAPGDYYAVATFMPQSEVRTYLEENVVATALALFDDRPPPEVRARLFDHVDQRFRLRYLLGDPDHDRGEIFRKPTSEGGDQTPTTITEVTSQLIALLDDAVAAEVESMISGGLASGDTSEDDLHVLLKDRLAANPTVVEIVGFLLTEVEARVAQLATSDLVTSRDGWPLYWRCHETDRDAFLKRLRSFTGNDHADFGQLLTPIVNGIRVRGPFAPTWAREIPYVMLIDREGLGHTPDSVSSLPSSTTRMFDDVDAIVLVDNAQQPMQAAPVAAMRQIAAAGHGDKLIVCFTHFELVQGPNLPNLEARRYHVIASVDQVLCAIGNELGYPTERLLRQRLDHNLYLLARIDQPVLEESDPETYLELRWLLSQLRVGAEPLELGDSMPIYSAEGLRQTVNDAVTAYLRYWELRLGVATDASVRPAHWSKVKALCDRYAHRTNDEYEAMRPAGDLVAALTDSFRRYAAEPDDWTDGLPDEDTEQQIYDGLTRRVNARLRILVGYRLYLDAAELWTTARDLSGPGAAQRRAEFVHRDILVPLIGAGGKPMGDRADFVSAVVDLVETEAAKLHIRFP